MTTKRKIILKTLSLQPGATMDNIAFASGLERKNLHDNIKATIKDGLCERIRDDVTGQPAYRLTTKGRAWLENDKEARLDAEREKIRAEEQAKAQREAEAKARSEAQAAAAKAEVERIAALPPVEPVKPHHIEQPLVMVDHIPDATKMVDAGKTIIEFCEWLAQKAKVRCPMNLHECKAVVSDLMQANEANIDLQSTVLGQAMTIKDQMAEIETLMAISPEMSVRIALLESNAELPLQTQTEPQRYIIADNYMTAATEEQANAIALDIAREIEMDTPVVVFAAHKARELRINWRDA